LVSSRIDTDPSSCRLDARLGDIRVELAAAAEGFMTVVDDDGVVAGVIGRDALAAGDDRFVESLLEEGPVTVRPSEDASELADRMRDASVETMLVTEPTGRLLGTFTAPPEEGARE
jgi:Mg/Co/Ni transporter MgtE